MRTCRDAVTWSIATSSDPFTGALVPWSVFPRYLRARELDQALQIASGGGASPSSSDAAESTSDWAAPFDQYMKQLGGVAAGGKPAGIKGRSVREPGRQVRALSLPSPC